MTIIIRRAGCQPTTHTNEEFRELVGQGIVLWNTPVWGKIFTDGQWWIAADLAMFHEHSPTVCPKGPRLVQEEASRARLEAQRRSLAPEVARARRDHIALHRTALGLCLLADECARYHAVGVARLWKTVCFEGDLVCTLVWSKEKCMVTLTRSDTDYSLGAPRLVLVKNADASMSYQQATPVPFDSRSVTKSVHSLSLASAEQPFSEWESFVDWAVLAESCEHDALDGALYTHELYWKGTEIHSSWINPDPTQDWAQQRLILAYETLVRRLERAASKRWWQR